jgi:hypothetical protein
LIVVDDPAIMVYLGYGFENPRPGPWQITLLATAETPAEGTDFALTAHLEGGARLAASAEPLLPELGQVVRLAGALTLGEAGLAIDQAVARVTGPDGRVETVTLAVTGDSFEGEWAPASAGLYGLDLSVTAQTPDGTPVERTAFLAIEAQPRPNVVRSGLALAAIVGGVLCVLVLVLVGSVLLGLRLLRGRRR